jgi:hypothetical protein
VDGERSVAWAGRRAITAFGAVTVLYWLSHAVFPAPIPPLVPLDIDISGLLKEIQPWIREQNPALNRPDAEILASFRRELIVTFAKSWLQIAGGVASGILVARRRRSGRVLAIALCGALLAFFLLGQVGHIWNHRLVAYWVVLAERAPVIVVRTVVNVMFATATLAYLTRRPVALQFARRDEAQPAGPATRS